MEGSFILFTSEYGGENVDCELVLNPKNDEPENSTEQFTKEYSKGPGENVDCELVHNNPTNNGPETSTEQFVSTNNATKEHSKGPDKSIVPYIPEGQVVNSIIIPFISQYGDSPVD